MGEVSFGGNIYLDEESRKQIAEIVKKAAEKHMDLEAMKKEHRLAKERFARMMSERAQKDPRTAPWKRYALKSMDTMVDIRKAFERLLVADDGRPDEEKEASYRDVAEYVELVLAGVQSFIEAHTQKYGPEALDET